NVVSSEVNDWIADKENHVGIHMFDHIAQHGGKSITIYSKQPKSGRWHTKVNVKPWSVYKFTGWIKTENLVPEQGVGAGFHMNAYGTEFELITEAEYFSGDSDWTEVSFQFETGDQDCVVLECLFNRGGKASGQVWFDNLSLEVLSSENPSPSISIDLQQEQEIMQDYVYGQFIEHLGRCIYGGIWAEMLEDRKFYYAPNERLSPWTTEGVKESLLINRTNSFVGDLTPGLKSSGQEEIKLIQSGLGIHENMSYSGRIVLKSEGLTEVGITLIWGQEESQKSTFIIKNIPDHYTTFPISFNSSSFCENASLIIEPKGKGIIWIGTISLMPDDNIDGFRKDVLSLLKELNSPIYRWPGGNFVSGYDWKDGVGDPDQRPPRKNPAWTGVEHNDVGIHEFMRFCELLDTEPYIAVNAGLGGAEEARKQVEYCNGDSSTKTGKWRMSNGHTEPWNVKWWCIGNEMYGGWQLGFMSTQDFVKKHNAFAEAMRSVDQDINLVAVGDLGQWDEMILTNCSDNMEYISEHFYRQDWHGGGLMTHINQIPKAIKQKADGHRKYREEIPGLDEKDIRICLDEWNYWYGPHIYGELGTRYYLRDGLGVAAGINEFSRQSDMIYMANYAQTVNVIGAIKATTTHSVMAATGKALTMYRKYFGNIPLELSGETRPLDIAATITKDRKYLTVSIVNLSWESQLIPIKFEGSEKFKKVEIITLAGASDMAYNVPKQKESVWVTEPKIVEFNGKLRINPVEARIFRFAL
ncbi:MAG: hypothetical protein KAH17_03795, partial [Bacteroidales bacterium]|nr:hypothetical protein [Bacteroidales bacterium]